MRRWRLLLADNEVEYRRSVRSLLELVDYDVVEASSLAQAVAILEAESIDLVLADQRLTDDEDSSDISGLRLAKAAAAKQVPCIVMTAFASVETVRTALRGRGPEALADDFVQKTEGPHALLAVIKSVLQRSPAPAATGAGDLVVDHELRLAWHEGREVCLSRHQYALLDHLDRHRGVVCEPRELIRAVYGEDLTPEQASSDKRLERLVQRLRDKIEADPRRPRHLVKEPRRGYRLVADP